MSIKDVERAITEMRDARDDWDEVDLGHWREIDTRYTFIDPMLGALGWEVSDPKECYPEYPRGDGAVDYALFDSTDMEGVGRFLVAPDAVIEAKNIRTSLDGEVSQLEGYVKADAPMRKGVAVLTNGKEWRIYCVTRSGSLASGPVEVTIFEGNRRDNARTLNEKLGRTRFSLT